MSKIKYLIITMSLMASVVLAQPGTTISSENALAGATDVAVTVNYLGTSVGSPNGIVGFQAKFTYDNTKVQVSATGLNACSAIYTCTDDGSSINMVAFTFPSSELPSTQIDIGFDMLAGAVNGDVIALNLIPGPTTVNVDGEEYVDFNANPVAVVGSSNGSITIVAGPTPVYGSTPADGTPLAVMSVLQNSGTDPTTSLVINNNAGDADTTLTGTCALTTGAPFSFDGGSEAFSVAQNATATGVLTDTVILSCDNTAAQNNYTDTVTCTSNGGADATYAVECDVTPPLPTYTSNPAAGATIDLGTAFSGSGDLTTSLEISNTGDATSTLNSGNCALTGANMGAFSIGANLSGAAAILAGNSVTETITCNDPGLGNGNGTLLTATLSCDNDDGGTDPQTYSLQCTYNEPGQAQYASTPADGATIEMTPTPLLVGSASPTASIVISNPAPGVTDNSLGITGCTYAGNPEISVTSADPLTATLAPQSAATETVALTCNTATVGNYTGTYSCPYSTDGVMGAEGTATYTVNCDIRAAESAGSPSAGTSTASITSPPGGSTTSTVVTFSELNNEGLDITGLSCALTTGTDFVLTVPPATVPAGGNVPVEVTFTDPGTPGPYTDTLTCSYTDSAGASGNIIVDLTGAVRAIVVPTLSTMGYIAMIFGLLLVGFFGVRRRA